jgi:predicted phage-related endonuclease
MPRSVPIPDEAAWHSIRESHIGGSEVASLFYRWITTDGEEVVRHMFEEVPEDWHLLECLSPHKTGYRLWQEKAGQLMPDSFDENERIQAGIHLEPAIAEWSKQKWEWPLRKVHRYLQHDTIDGWGASLDYELHGDGLTRVPVELKNVDFVVFRDKWLVDDGEIMLPPMNYLLQLQHQIGAAGTDHGWIVACVAGNKLHRGRIERHEASQQKIGEAIAAFWAAVRSGVSPNRVADAETVSKLLAEGESGKLVDLSDNERFSVLCGQYARLKRHMDRMDVRASNLKGRLMELFGDATKAKGSRYRASWPSITRQEKLIPARTQSALTYRGALTITKIEEAK